MHSFDFIHDGQIKTTPDRVWDALVNPETVAKYHLAPLRHFELKRNGVIIYGLESKPMITGKIVDFQVGRKLVHTFPACCPNRRNDCRFV